MRLAKRQKTLNDATKPGTTGRIHFTLVSLLLGLSLLAMVSRGAAQMAVKGTLLLAEDFRTRSEYPKERQPVKEGWQVRAAHARWERSPDGVRSVWEKGHMPVLVYEANFSNAVIEVDFRFSQQAGKWGGCRISASNPELNPRAYAVSLWANSDGSGHDRGRPQGLLLEHDEWSAGPEKVAHTPGEFHADTWHTLRLEFIGTNALATCNGISVLGSHEKFGLAKKSISLGVGTCPHELRNFRVWEAQPNAAWSPQMLQRKDAPKPLDERGAK